MNLALMALLIAMGQPGPPDVPAPAGAPRLSGLPLAPPVNLDPRTALEAIRRAYTTGPTSDRLALTVRKGDRVIGRGQLLVRVDPGAGEGHPGATVSIEATPLRIWAGPGAAHVILVANPDTVCSTTFDGPVTPAALVGFLPPTPVPALGLLRAGREVASTDLLPWMEPVPWTGATLVTLPEPPILRIIADGPSGSLRVEADATSGRLRAISANLPDGVVVDIALAPVAESAMPDWPATVGSRLRVESMGDLPRRPGELVVGRMLHDPVILREGGAGSSAAVLAGTRGVALIALRPLGVDPADAQTRRAVDAAVREACTQLGDPPPGVVCAAAALLPPADQAAWAAIPWAEADGPRALIADAAVGRLVGAGRGGRGGVLVVGGDGRVRGWIAVRPEVDVATVSAEIVKAARGG